MLAWEDMKTAYETMDAKECMYMYIEIKQFAQLYILAHEDCNMAFTSLLDILSSLASCKSCSSWMQGTMLAIMDKQSWSSLNDTIQTFDDAFAHLSFAIGIYYPKASDTFDTAAYKSKLAAQQSKDYPKYTTSYEIYDTLLEENIHYAMQVQGAIVQAMETGKLRVFLQPKVDVTTQTICGAEALLRWYHQNEWLPLADWMPILQKNSFIRQLDLFVLQQIFHLFHACEKQNLPRLPVSVNISAPTLADQDVYLTTLKTLQQHFPKAPKLLEFEISEDITSYHNDALLTFMNALHTNGYRIAMDDFGSGSASLIALTTMPFTTIKLDKAFFPIPQNAKNNHVLQSVLHILKYLKLAVVAEGVEDDTYLNLLKQADCDQIQGYYYYQAMPLSAYMRLLKSWH